MTPPGVRTGCRYAALNNRDWLNDQYTHQGKSDRMIAAELGCCTSTVWYYRDLHGIPSLNLKQCPRHRIPRFRIRNPQLAVELGLEGMV